MNTIKIIIPLLIFSIFIENAHYTQTISQFTWEVGPTTPDVGPVPTSVSGSATVGPGGASATNGLNAGLPKADINLTITGAAYDVDGADISIDYQYEEAKGSFFKRGNSLSFGFVADKLRVQYRIDDGLGGFVQITQNNIYTIPVDDTYRNYRFKYDANTGFAEVLVDGLVEWDNTGSETPGQNLYWTGAGDLIIGHEMDSEGSNSPFMDNMIFIDIPVAPLPITLTDFSADIILESEVELVWTTASELNNDTYTVERSTNGYSFEPIGTLAGAGNSSTSKSYSFIDNMPVEGTAYYRLKQTDFDGTSTYSRIIVAEFSRNENSQCTLIVYPNPCVGSCTVKLDDCAFSENDIFMQVYDISGNVISNKVKSINEDEAITFDLNTTNNMSPGIYIVKAGAGDKDLSEKVIVK